jgi:hypothetical protein
MPKTSGRYKAKPKKEKVYTKVLDLAREYSFEERESIIRRAIYSEQDKYKGKPFRFIIAEKTMKQVKINFFVK